MASGAKSLPKCIQVFWIIAWLACGPVDLEHLETRGPCQWVSSVFSAFGKAAFEDSHDHV
jgi:hypothetical protein